MSGSGRVRRPDPGGQRTRAPGRCRPRVRRVAVAITPRRLAPVAALAGVLALASTSLPARAQAIDSYWPHAVGAAWTYDRVQIEWNGARAKPDFAAVRFTLGDSTIVIGTARVQPLTVQLPGAAPERAAAFDRQLAIARPGLRSRQRAAASSGLVVHDERLIRVAGDEIAAYRAEIAARAWIYLGPDLAPGHGFELQLVPDLADSIFLRGTVLGPTDVSTPAGSYAGALRVRYDVDYGWTDAVDDSGEVVGRFRSRTRGEMFYAPGVGPVLARETFVPRDRVQGSPPPAPVDSTFAELRLESCVLQPSAVARAPWSAVKRRYR